MRILFPLVFVALISGSVAAQAQTRVFYNNDSSPTGTSANTFPWSREQLRYQVIFPAASFQGKPWVINDILAAPQPTMSPTRKTAIYQDIEIRMGLTAQSSLSSNWSTNNPKPTTVYRGPLQCDFEVGKWRGLGLPNPYLYIPLPATPNLCVEFIIWKMDPSTASIRAVTTSAPRAYYYQWTTSQATQASVSTGSAAKMGLVLTSANWVEAGSGCTGSNNNVPTLTSQTYPVLGKPFQLDVSGCRPGSAGILMLGLERNKWSGLTFPFDLKPLGAPGCLVWNEPLVTAGLGIDQSGNGKTFVPIPSFIGNLRLYTHVWNLDPLANSWGVTTTNLGVILPGN